MNMMSDAQNNVTSSIAVEQVAVPSEEALLRWLESAEAGSRFLYHFGHLGADRAREGSPLSVAARHALSRIANLVMELVDDGRLLAAQQRVHDRFAYLAIKPSESRNGRQSMTSTLRRIAAPAASAVMGAV